MTVILDLPPQVEQAYLAAARARGLQLAELVREVLVASQPVAGPADLTPEEWLREFRVWAHSHDRDNLPMLSDEALSRDSVYE